MNRQHLDDGGGEDLVNCCGHRAKSIADQICSEQRSVPRHRVKLCTWCNASPAEIDGLCHPCNDYRLNGGGA